jgi:hypothetical protein
MQYYKISTEHALFVDELINSKTLKTGDLILFKAYNNFNSIFHGSYFGHVGMVYIDPNDSTKTPMLFEANGIERVPLKEHHSRRGVFLTPLVDRIKKYKGRCFWKSLALPLDKHAISDFSSFIDFCLTNFEYDYNVFSNAFKKMFGFKRCDLKTDCGQIMFLSLIKLGLIPVDEYDIPRLNHLTYVCNIEELTGNYFNKLVEVIDHPFAY